jgi:hypothetical protein
VRGHLRRRAGEVKRKMTGWADFFHPAVQAALQPLPFPLRDKCFPRPPGVPGG